MMDFKTLFDNEEVILEIDQDGNYRVSFFEDSHWKEEYVYIKSKNIKGNERRNNVG